MGLYFEAHITVAPEMSPERIVLFEQISKEYDFRVSTFFLKDGAPAADQAKMFTSGRSEWFVDLEGRMRDVITTLHYNFFKVVRYKIEDTILN